MKFGMGMPTNDIWYEVDFQGQRSKPKVTRSENVILNHGSAAHRPGAGLRVMSQIQVFKYNGFAGTWLHNT